jgi:hypothetical protein
VVKNEGEINITLHMLFPLRSRHDFILTRLNSAVCKLSRNLV